MNCSLPDVCVCHGQEVPFSGWAVPHHRVSRDGEELPIHSADTECCGVSEAVRKNGQIYVFLPAVGLLSSLSSVCVLLIKHSFSSALSLLFQNSDVECFDVL